MAYCVKYDADEVAKAVAAVWDLDIAVCGADTGTYVEGGMPKGAVNPAHGNTWLAKCADVSRAWEMADMTPGERASVFLIHGMHMHQKHAATVMGYSQGFVSKQADAGIGKMVDYLNGL